MFKRWHVASLLVAIGMVATIAMPVLAQQASDYDYSTAVTVTNNTGAALTNTPVRASFNTKNMIDGGFLATDMLDILTIATVGGAEALITAQGTNTNDASWWFPVSSLADGASASYTTYTGQNTTTADNPQGIYLSGASESVDVTADTSLEFTANLTIEATFTLDEIPSDTTMAYIATKSTTTFDYWVGVRNGDEVVAGLGPASAGLDIFGILGSTGLIIPIGEDTYEPATPTTVTTCCNSLGGASDVIFTYSENRDAWDTAAGTVGNVPDITFNGTDEEGDSPDAAYWSLGDGSNDTAASWGAWVNIDGANSGTILAKFTSPDTDREWVFDLNAGKPRLFLRDQSAGVAPQVEADAALSTGAWHHIVVTYGGLGGASAADDMAVYVDGTAVASTATNNASYVAMENLTAVVALGSLSGPAATYYTDRLAGGLAGPFFTKIELTAQQVSDLYDLTRDGTAPNVAGNNSVSVTGALAVDTETNVLFTYDGSNLELTVGASTATNDIGAIAIGTSTSPLVIGHGDLVGSVDSVLVGDLYADVLAILGSSAEIMSIGSPESEPDDATTFRSHGTDAGDGSVFTYSESRDDWDTTTTYTSFASIPVVTFNGSDEYANTPDANKWSFGDGSNDSPVSIGAWINFGGSSNRAVLAKYESTGSAQEWNTRLVSGDRFRFEMGDPSAGVFNVGAETNAAVGSAGEWIYVVATYDGSGGASAGDGITLYVNGTAVASTATNNASYVATENAAGVMEVGQSDSAAWQFDGAMLGGPLGPFFTPTELSAADVGNLYAIGLARYVDETDDGYDLDLRFEGDQLTETQAGTAANSWNWLGTVIDQSSAALDTSYTFVRDTSNITVTVGQVQSASLATSSGSGETAPVVLTGSVTDPFGDSFDESGGLAFPFSLLVSGDAGNTIPVALVAMTVAIALAVAGAALLFFFTRMPGLGIVGATLGGAVGVIVSPIADAMIILMVMMALAMIVLMPRPFETVGR